ncbi:MAG: hypothetical protein WA484_08190 [Solirubrobacteraceae bacterium]
MHIRRYAHPLMATPLHTDGEIEQAAQLFERLTDAINPNAPTASPAAGLAATSEKVERAVRCANPVVVRAQMLCLV